MNNLNLNFSQPHNYSVLSESTSSSPIIKPSLKTEWVLCNCPSRSIAYLKNVIRQSSNGGSNSEKSEDLEKIVRLIHECKAHELFDRKAPTYIPQPNSLRIGEGMHQFLDLQECACNVLDRITKPSIRAEYEKQVLDKIETLANEMSIIPIAIFASGMLFGEFVLLVKILKLLENKNWNGELRLFFIDTVYESAQGHTLMKSQNVAKKTNENQTASINRRAAKIPIALDEISLGQCKSNDGTVIDKAAKAIQTFVDLLRKITTPSIAIKSFFFESTDDYTLLSKQNPKFKNILQIGSDIDNNRLLVFELVSNTQAEQGAGMVVLVPRPVLDQDGNQKTTPDGVCVLKPMIFFKKTKADPVQYNWLPDIV